MDEGEVVGGELVVASGDPATLLDLVEEPLDQIARTIGVTAKTDWLRPVSFRRRELESRAGRYHQPAKTHRGRRQCPDLTSAFGGTADMTGPAAGPGPVENGRWSQPIDATLYLKEKRWSV